LSQKLRMGCVHCVYGSTCFRSGLPPCLFLLAYAVAAGVVPLPLPSFAGLLPPGVGASVEYLSDRSSALVALFVPAAVVALPSSQKFAANVLFEPLRVWEVDRHLPRGCGCSLAVAVVSWVVGGAGRG